MRLLFTFLTALMWSSFAFGQVNLESDRHTAGGKEGFHFDTSLSLGFQRGNVRVFQYQIGLRTDYIHKYHHLYLLGSTGYGEENANAFQNQKFGHLRWTWMFLGDVGVEVFSQAESDEFKLLRLRQLNGGGVRAVLVEEKGLLFAVGVGAMSDYERVATGSDLVARGTSYLSLSNEGARMKSTLVGYFQPKLRSFADYRVLLQGALEFPIIKKLSWVNLISYAYDTEPPEGVVKEDMRLTVNLKYKWR